MEGSLSAIRTTLATRRAITVAPASDESWRPYCRAIRARSRSTMLKEIRKKMVGGSTSKNSCVIVLQTLLT
jgi:hypothetical protein